MAVKGNYRLYRKQLYIVATPVVLLLALVLYVRVSTEAAQIVLEALSVVVLTMIFSNLLLEKWFWKTKLANLLGFPPDYSGKWEGVIERTSAKEGCPTTSRVIVTLSQQITQMEWNQTTYDDDDNVIANSHFVLGEIVDYHKEWDGIIGFYEVKRTAGQVDEGMSLVTINERGNEMTGHYCGLNKHVGLVKLTKIEE